MVNKILLFGTWKAWSIQVKHTSSRFHSSPARVRDIMRSESMASGGALVTNPAAAMVAIAI